MQPQDEKLRETLTRLERLKQVFFHCATRAELLPQIDNIMELIYELIGEEQSGSFSFQLNLHSKILYLKDLRASSIKLTDAQVHDFCKELVLFIAVLQFDLWQGTKQDLYSLLDSVAD